MSVTNVYKTVNVSKAGEVFEAHSGKRANDDHALNLITASRVKSFQEIEQSRPHFLAFAVGHMSGKNNPNFLSNGVHLLQKFVIESRHISPNEKLGSVAA